MKNKSLLVLITDGSPQFKRKKKHQGKLMSTIVVKAFKQIPAITEWTMQIFKMIPVELTWNHAKQS